MNPDPNTPTGATPKPHNPDNLTPEQVGVSDGWRLLDEDEILGSTPTPYAELSAWGGVAGDSKKWDDNGWNGALSDTTYRTRLSRAELRAARGLAPALPASVQTARERVVEISPELHAFAANGAQTHAYFVRRGSDEWELGEIASRRLVWRLQRDLDAKQALLDAANAENARLIHERDGWIQSAREFSDGLEFYRGIVWQIGEMFGVAAKTSDDGSIQQDVLALKVPELVAALALRVARLEAALRKARTRISTLRPVVMKEGSGEDVLDCAIVEELNAIDKALAPDSAATKVGNEGKNA